MLQFGLVLSFGLVSGAPAECATTPTRQKEDADEEDERNAPFGPFTDFPSVMHNQGAPPGQRTPRVGAPLSGAGK